jgi:hypothetical protein
MYSPNATRRKRLDSIDNSSWLSLRHAQEILETEHHAIQQNDKNSGNLHEFGTKTLAMPILPE